MIWEELRDDLIFYDLQAVDYKEVLQSMGDAMIQAGYGEQCDRGKKVLQKPYWREKRTIRRDWILTESE